MFEVSGYGNIFLVKADTQQEAEAKVHEWAEGEGFSRVRISIHEVQSLTKFA
jgi:hypothetical protein